MARIHSTFSWLLVIGAILLSTGQVQAQTKRGSDENGRPFRVPQLELTYASDAERGTTTQPAVETQPAQGPRFDFGYRGLSGFFNVREANPNVRRGEWELEFPFKWSTRSGESDEFEVAQSLKYGITDRLYAELEVEQPRLGDGGDSGAGDLKLQFFYQFLEETDNLPAIAGFAEARFPTGDGSSGVDGKVSGIVTKSLGDRFRFHFQGFLLTANGSSGAGGGDREPFQWGLGPGFDYLLSDNAVVVLNYLHRNNPTEGLRDQDILEVGTVFDLGRIGKVKHELKLAADVGLNGDNSSPEFGAKIQWGIEW